MERIFENRLTEKQKNLILNLFELRSALKQAQSLEAYETLNFKICEIEKELGFYD